jgi:hypothetical protein
MTARSIGLCLLAGLASVDAGCAQAPHARPVSDASVPTGASTTDARSSASGGNPTGSGGTGGSPDVGGGAANTPWTLPHTGGPIWRNSTVPYCGSEDGYIGHVGDLWSDSRGVYVIRTVPPHYGLFFNSGSGWSRVSPQPRAELQNLAGIPAGPLFLYGDSFDDTSCGITLFDGRNESCIASFSSVSNVFAVSAERVFAITNNRLLWFNNAYFTQYGIIPTSPWPYYQLWADSQVVIVSDHAGNLFLYDDVSSAPEVLALPDGLTVESLWGFSRHDLWVGDESGRLLHYDGESWTALQVAQGNCLQVNQLWGAEGVLYFATDSHVGRWTEGRVDTVLDGPCVQDSVTSPGTYEQVSIQRIWGNSPTELFIAVEERKETMTLVGSNGATFSDVGPDSCGQFRLYWFDGQSLGRL